MSLITNRQNIFEKAVIGNARQAQEDSHDKKLDTPNGDIFVVCDGMGGHVGGAKASSLAVESIISYLNKQEYPDPITALNGALQFANTQILGFASANPEYKGMGTTACIVLMKQSEVWIAHVGDSRIYLFLGKEKELHRITKDHSYVQTLVDAGQISDEDAEHHPNKNRILKALGIVPQVEPTFNYGNNPICPKNDDVFLICSDGLSGMIPDSTIERVMGQNISLEEKGELLINLAMEGETVHPGGQDNCTLEMIQIDNSPWNKSTFVSYNPKQRKRSNRTSESPSKKIVIAFSIVAALLFIAAAIILWQPMKRNKMHDIENNIKGITTEINHIQKDLNIPQFNYNNDEAKRITILIQKCDVLLEDATQELKKTENAIKQFENKTTQQAQLATIELTKTKEDLTSEIDRLSKRKIKLEEKKTDYDKYLNNWETLNKELIIRKKQIK